MFGKKLANLMNRLLGYIPVDEVADKVMRWCAKSLCVMLCFTAVDGCQVYARLLTAMFDTVLVLLVTVL